MSRAVIFDIGGVLIDWSPRHLYRKLLPDEARIDAFFAEVGFAEWNVAQDAGRPWAVAVAELSADFPRHARLIEAADRRWQEMVAGPIAGAVALLEACHAKGAPLYAITNFSSEKWVETRARFDFMKRFRDVIVSGDERVMKPDPEIYRRLLARNGLRAGDCLFIDDSPRNVAGAEAVGMAAIRFTDPAALQADLVRLGVLP